MTETFIFFKIVPFVIQHVYYNQFFIGQNWNTFFWYGVMLSHHVTFNVLHFLNYYA